MRLVGGLLALSPPFGAFGHLLDLLYLMDLSTFILTAATA
jgi:hypothetical protein